MKKILSIISILVLLAPEFALASFTFVNGGQGGGSASSATVTATVNSVHVGDLIVCMIKWESTTTTVTVKDSSLNAFTNTVAGIKNINGGFTTASYLLSSPIAGNIVYTATFGAARTFKDFVCQAYTPSGTASLDGTAVAAANVTGTTIGSSGNMTTTGTDGVSFGYYGETGNTPSAEQINSINAAQITHGGTVLHSSLWSLTYSAGFTGAATVTLGTGANYNGGIISFKNTAVAATAGSPRSFWAQMSFWAPMSFW